MRVPLTYKFSSMKIAVCLQKPVFAYTKIPNVKEDNSSYSSHYFYIYPLQNSEDAIASLFLRHPSTGVSRIPALHRQNAHNNFIDTENPIKLGKQTTQQQGYYNPHTFLPFLEN